MCTEQILVKPVWWKLSFKLFSAKTEKCVFSPGKTPVLSSLSCWSSLVTFGKRASGGNIAGGLFEGLCLMELSQSI